MSDSLDELAAFLMHRTVDTAMSKAQSLSVFVLVDAYQEGDSPAEVAAGLRAAALGFSSRPDYRPEWRLTRPDALLLAADPLLLSTVVEPGLQFVRSASRSAPTHVDHPAT